MSNILIVNSSLQGENGNSNKLAKMLAQEASSHSISELDLNAIELPHLSGEEMSAWAIENTARTEAQKALAHWSETFVKQIQTSDVIVVGVPMYNFGIPSTLKAWIDRIARAGITFAYTDKGPKGLLENKKVIILAARGGMYEGTAADTQTPYLKTFFNFLGLSDIKFVYAEGLAMGDAETVLASANTKIKALVSNF